MDLHYVVNPTMEPMERDFFLPSMPAGFRVNRHPLENHTSGNFMKDGYLDLLLARTRAICREIENNPDDGVMVWSDVDLVFFSDQASILIERAMVGFDLLFQKESPALVDDTCNFGFQVIRRNKTTLRFYERLLEEQRLNRDRHDQYVGNKLLLSHGSPRWGHLPVTFSSQSNGGFGHGSVLYHANMTPNNSQARKRLLLGNALEAMRAAQDEGKSIPTDGGPIKSGHHDAGFASKIALLEDFLNSPDPKEFIWLIDDSVYCDERTWEAFFGSFDGCPADLLATDVRVSFEAPKWNWWGTIAPPEDKILARGDQIVAAFLPVARLSRRAARVIIEGWTSGWKGHPEVLVPTLIRQAGLTIEDIGGNGHFTPQERKGRWYSNRTYRWCGPVEHLPGMLHFPAPIQQRALAPARISPAKETASSRILYVSPVGSGATELLPDVLEIFRNAGADFLFLKYDEAELPLPPHARVVREKGFKFPLAVRHLHPDAVAEYDFIFFWDDDLGVRDFDPERFVRIMRANRLDIAQPAIRSPHGLSHAITKHRPSPPPWRAPDGGPVHPVVGRLTNFVEIMAPVFTREAWREFYSYLDPENRSGWGYDYIPLGRKGIVDALPVIHTRAVQSINNGSENEIRKFLDDQGLFRHAPVEHGWLFEWDEPGTGQDKPTAG